MQPESKENQTIGAESVPNLSDPAHDARLPYAQPRVETSQQQLQAMLASSCGDPDPS